MTASDVTTDTDRAEFEARYREHRGMVYSQLLARTHNAHLAEDLTATAFAKAWEHRDRFDGRNFGGWVRTIATNTHLDHVKSSAAQQEVPTADLPETTSNQNETTSNQNGLEEQVISTEERSTRVAALERGLADLTDLQRETIELALYEDLSVARIAEVTGRSHEAVRALRRRAYENLRSPKVSRESSETVDRGTTSVGGGRASRFDLDEAVRLYRSGATLTGAAAEVGCSLRTVARALEAADVPIRRTSTAPVAERAPGDELWSAKRIDQEYGWSPGSGRKFVAQTGVEAVAQSVSPGRTKMYDPHQVQVARGNQMFHRDTPKPAERKVEPVADQRSGEWFEVTDAWLEGQRARNEIYKGPREDGSNGDEVEDRDRRDQLVAWHADDQAAEAEHDAEGAG